MPTIDPFSFTDSDGCEWVRNLDGTYRCLHADLSGLTYDEIVAEFGLLV